MLLGIKQYVEDIDRVIDSINLNFYQLEGKSIYIAGATGLIGSGLADMLIRMSDKYDLNLKLILSGRSITKLEKRFASYVDDSRVTLICQDVCDSFDTSINADYIIHSASDANPVAYANYPVEVMKSNFIGMLNILNYGKAVGASRIMYVSSGEIYGKLDDSHDGFDEMYSGYVNHSDPRSCYPASKRAAEVLCQSYIKEYGMDVVIVRPCHIYGPTMTDTDTRAATAFIRNAANGEDIILKSDGSARRTMCYVFDTVAAMIYVLLQGNNGEAYNISDELCDVSIRDIAQIAAECGGTKLVFDLPNQTEVQGFNRVKNAVLLSGKIQTLGWKPVTDLKTGISTSVNIQRLRRG